MMKTDLPTVHPRSIAALRRTHGGMTLIEVMLAMAILAIGLFVLIASVGRSIAVVRAARIYDRAHMLLNQVDLMEPLIGVELEAETKQGRFSSPEHRGYEWIRIIEEEGDEEDRLFRITTRVSWTRLNHTSFEETVQLRYSPTDEPISAKRTSVPGASAPRTTEPRTSPTPSQRTPAPQRR